MKKTRYSIGYGKPPKHSRFKPGQSGNPRGRPKGARGFKAELVEELKKTISVTEAGRTRKLSKQKAMIKALVAKALKGDSKSIQIVWAHSAEINGSAVMQPDLEAVDQLILDEYRHRPEDAD